MSQNKSISIIVPVYNEEKTLTFLAERLSQVFATLENNYVLNAVLVDDGSKDGSWLAIEKICSKDGRFSGIRLSRNFGHQAALSCGYQFAPGDAVICIDADLQDPPELSPELIRRWEEGNRVVLAVRRKREGETKFKLLSAKLYYKLISRISDSKAPRESGDFRLLDRAAVDAFNRLSESHRYIRGLVGWLGFRSAIVEYDRLPRQGGRTKYTLTKMMRLAMDGIISFSFLPLRLAYIVACILVLPFLLYLAYNFVLHIFFGVTMVPGWSSLILAVILFGVFNLLMLGVLGEYVGRIYTEAKRRPIFLVEESCGRDFSTFVSKGDGNV